MNRNRRYKYAKWTRLGETKIRISQQNCINQEQSVLKLDKNVNNTTFYNKNGVWRVFISYAYVDATRIYTANAEIKVSQRIKSIINNNNLVIQL